MTQAEKIQSFLIEYLSNNTIQVSALVTALLTLWITVIIITNLIRKRKKRKTLKESAEYVLLQITQTPHTETQMSEMEQIRLF